MASSIIIRKHLCNVPRRTQSSDASLETGRGPPSCQGAGCDCHHCHHHHPQHHQYHPPPYQECAVKAVRLERLVGATTSPRSCYLENNLLTFSMFQEQDEQERNGDWWQQRGGRRRRRRRRRRGEDWGEGESEWERSKENHSSHCSHKTLAWSTLWKVMTVRRWRRNLEWDDERWELFSWD